MIQDAQVDGGQGGGRTEAVLLYLGNIGQRHRSDLHIVRERALTNNSDITAQLSDADSATDNGSNGDQLLAVSRHDHIAVQNLEGAVLALQFEGIDLGGAEGKGANVIDIRANGNLAQVLTLIEHTLRQNRGIDIEVLQGSAAGEGISAILDLVRGDGHILQALTAGKSILADGQQAFVSLNSLQILVAGKGVIRDHTSAGQVNGTLQVTELKGVLVDDEQIVLTAEGDLLQLAAAVEGAVLDGLQSGRQHDLFQCSQLRKCICIDLLDALGDHHLGDGIFTDVPLLAGGGAVDQQFLRRFGNIIEVGEGEGADLRQGQVSRNIDQAAVTIVMAQDTTVVYVRILDSNGDGFRIIGRLAIQHHANGNGCKALLLSGDHTALADLNDILIAAFKDNRCIIREVCVQIEVQRNRLGRIHRQRILTVKEAGITGVAQQLILAVNHEIGFDRVVTDQIEHIRNGLIVATVTLVPLLKNCDPEGQALIGGGITNLNGSITGARGDQLIVNNADNAGTGGSELQQLSPFSVGVNQRLQRVNLIGAQGQTLFQAVEVEVQIIVGQADLVGGHVQSIVINSQHKGIGVQRFLLEGVNVIGQLVGHIGSAVALGIHGGHVVAEDLHGRSSIALIILTHGDIAQLGSHREVVVEDSNLSIQAVLLRSLIVLIVVLNIGDRGCLKVYHQGELEDITLIGLQAAVTVVHVTDKLDGVLGIVSQVVVHGIELNLDVCGIDRAAVTVGLTNIIVHSLEDYLAGGIIGNGNDDLRCVTQQAGPHKAQGVNGTLLVGQGNVISVGGDHDILGVLNEVVRTQVADVILRNTADRTGGVGVGHGLIFRIDAIIQLVGVGLIVVQVHQRSLGPVAVESQIRNAHINVGTGGGLQGNKAFHIHTVFEGLIHVSLIGIGQGDLNSNLSGAAAIDGDILAVEGTTLHGHDLNTAGQSISFFGHGGLTGIGLILADTLGQNIAANVIGQRAAAEVVNGEGHLVNTGLIGIVTQLQLGLVHSLAILIIGSQIGLGGQAVGQVSQTGALLTNGIRQAVGVQRNVRSGHHQLIDHLIDLHIVIGNVREILNHILTQQDNHTGQVRTCHGGTGQSVITATGNRRENIAAVSGDLRLDVQAGSGTPGREVGNKGAGSLIHANGQLAATGSSQHLAIILRDGADGQLGLTDVHLDVTGNIVVNDDTGSALTLSDHGLFLKGIGTTADKSDLALHIQSGIVSAAANTGDNNKFDFLGGSIPQQSLDKVQLLGRSAVGLIKIHDGVAVLQVGGLLTIDGSNGHNTMIGAGRTDRTGIGVGGQGQVTVLLGTKGRRIAVGSCDDNRDTCITQLIINAVHDLLVGLTGKAAGGTQRHIDNVNAQDHAVLQSRQNPAADGRIVNIREDLHGYQLRIGRNAGDDIVLTDDDAGNVGTMVIMGRVNVGIVIGVVIAERNLFVNVHIVNGQAAVLLAGNGITNQCGNILVGQAQLGGGEIIGRESGVVGIQTGIQHRNHHAAAIVTAAAAVEDAGVKHIDLIFNQLGLALLINLTDDNTLALAQRLAGGLKIPCFDGDLKTAEQRIIAVAGGVLDLLLIQIRQHLFPLGSNLLVDSGGIFAVERIVLEAHGLVTGFIGIHQVRNVNGDDHGDLVIILNIAGQLKHDRTIQIVLQVKLGRIIHQIDIGCMITGSLTAGSGEDANHHSTQEQTDARYPNNVDQGFLLHLFNSPFLRYSYT